MNVVNFGATGATGTLLVDQALEIGHTVTAFVRDRARLTHVHPELRTVVGDVMDASTLDDALARQDAVLCALGTMPESRHDRIRRQPDIPVCSVGTRNIIDAMTRHQIRRIIVESSACVGSSRRTGRFAAGHLVHLLLRNVMNDTERQEALVRGSKLNWTIIRPVRLSDGARTGQVRCGEELDWALTSTISWADVAAFMLDAILDLGTERRPLTLRN